MTVFHDPFGLVEAGQGARLAAFCIDALLGVAAATAGLLWGGAATLSMTLVNWALLAVLAIVQTILLSRSGQTLGKRAVRIQIVRVDTGRNGGFVTNVLMRTVLNWALSLIPFYSLVYVLFIFRPDRRCIHDLLANTRVVRK